MLRKTNGATIRALREALGISQASLAARAKVSKSYLCEIELGAHQPTTEKAQRIASELGVTLDAITHVVPEAAEAAS
jgi:transcriptional regulator with XRE-family HTH domain